MNLIVRRWDPTIEPTLEFRAFVVNRKLTACTQYYQLCYVEKISKNYELIKQLIWDYFETQVKHRVKTDTYTIDFAISPDLSTHIFFILIETDLFRPESLKVIEINHPPPTAGTSLFDWNNPTDRDVVSNGPYELRVLHKPVRTFNTLF